MERAPDGYYPMQDIDDATVEQFIHEHQGGASVVEVADALGISRERCYQILRKALAKCLVAALRAGITTADIPTRESSWDKF